MNATVATPQDPAEAALVADIEALVAVVGTVVIQNDDEFVTAGNLLKRLEAGSKRVTEWFKPLVDAANKAHKALTSRRAEVLEKPEAAIAKLRRAIGDYSTKKERERQEAERLAQAEARQVEEARVLQEAAALERAGDRELANQVMEQAAAAPPVAVVVPSTTPRVAGVTTVEAWDFEIVNEALVPREFCSVDRTKIRRRVTDLKSGARIPGVRVFRSDRVRVTA